ncbi:MAG: DoxX family protein [Labilithrix sp.]|nr:DoxX family protein [Labilithrix sp.]
MSTPLENPRLAHALARLGLGLNIALHGISRLPDLPGFAAGVQASFDKSPLPPSWVYASSLAIPVAETLFGLLIFAGIELRRSLVAGTLLMIFLVTGACSAQNWTAASIQMTYLGFYVALIATLRHDALSIDAWRRERKQEHGA